MNKYLRRNMIEILFLVYKHGVYNENDDEEQLEIRDLLTGIDPEDPVFDDRVLLRLNDLDNYNLKKIFDNWLNSIFKLTI
jgi:hypothetical protein